MQTIDSAVQLNNESYHLMKTGNYQEAVALLMKGLRFTKASAENETKADEPTSLQDTAPAEHSMVDTSSVMESTSSTSSSPSERIQATSLQTRSLAEDESSRLQCTRQERIPSKSSYVHTDPCYLEVETLRGDDDSVISHVSSIVIFNLSLSYHCMGLCHGEESGAQKYYTISKRLYELAFKMQTQNPGTNIFHVAALLNNLAIVNKALGRTKESEQCQQHLLRAVLLIVDTGGFTNEDNKDMVDGFLGNVMHLFMKRSPVASAA